MKLLNFTVIKLTVFLIIGILLGYYISVELSTSIVFTVLVLGLLTASYFIQNKKLTKTVWFGIMVFIAMICVGILTVNLHNQKNFTNHYSNYISEDLDTLHTINFRIKEVLKPSKFYDKYIIEVLKVDADVAVGKSLLNIKKDSLHKSLTVDENYIIRTAFKNLIPPLNPGQFNYKSYLNKKYIYHQLSVEPHTLLELKDKTTTIFGIANTVRAHINSKLILYDFNKDELAIINALLLGQRQDISEEIYTSYANAGAIHILAISGLHIGIILIILNFIFKPIEQIKNGKLLKAGILIFILWSFAIIAGLSASVTRAVTMFSIVTLGLSLNRPTNIYNTLAISILVLLLFKPMFLFDVGFQLSYLAVFAIVSIDPIFYKLWQPKNWLLDKYWHTITITFAAQFGIIPISLFYFHQFPGLFFMSNLIIIPVLGIILGFGILIILLAVLNALPNFIASIYGTIISYMNYVVTWIARQEQFLFKDIPFSFIHVITFYLLIIFLFRLYFRKNLKNLKLFLLAVIVLQCVFIFSEYQKPNHKFIVFHKSRYSLIGNVTNNTIKVSHDFDSLTKRTNTIIRDFKVENYIGHSVYDSLPSFIVLGSKKVLIIDSLAVYKTSKLQPDYVLLRQSPKLNLERVINTLKPKMIIADGSNYKSYVERWESICKNKKLPFHQTDKKGAYVINY
ncbi:ComEC/Rec2 family competence protein [Hyunsoonleella pacifica]|uniref:ComEC family competence protein n=1 Tax=Hyunsoonleella pacifica TaxID=1080224 RepID=A0A4Q9FM22_9FLAO|nr:ComEC/Rec2 family competence protein [Hyunsoonleella pacifica]TBN14710.1 ComEC family competence protein [Hyunsoonleella pacifica]GGD16050.1 competence protein ComEC [Hyunsoonleella pacifica]